jgi:hypothetical protein
MTASTEVQALAPIINQTRGADMDHQQMWDQVNRWTWIGMAAKPELRHPDALQIAVHVGAGRKRRIYVKLNARDLYDIELGRLKRVNGLPEYVALDQVTDIYAENLDEELRNLFDRHTV